MREAPETSASASVRSRWIRLWLRPQVAGRHSGGVARDCSTSYKEKQEELRFDATGEVVRILVLRRPTAGWGVGDGDDGGF